MSDSANPFAPPQAEVADVRTDGLPDLATRGSRLGAALIDMVLQLALLAVAARLTGIQIFTPDPTATSLAAGLLLSLTLFALLHGLLLVRHGQTIGKRIVGIRIVRPDGGRVAPGRLLGLRYLIGFVASVVPVLGPIYGVVDSLLVFRANRRCLHDLIADTIVVRA